MQKFISKKTESDLTKLGLYQIVGSAVGLVVIIWSIYNSGSIDWLTILFYLFISLFFVYSFFCGAMCMKANENALRLSLVNQLLQLISFAILGYAFKYVAGIYFTIGLDLKDTVEVGFAAGISKFEFNFNKEKDRFDVDFNLVAFFLVYWIDKLMKQVKEELAIRTEATIGEI